MAEIKYNYVFIIVKSETMNSCVFITLKRVFSFLKCLRTEKTNTGSREPFAFFTFLMATDEGCSVGSNL